ncbi:MAG: hypothetical protein IJD92_03760 [Bacilli bacterium]|nr:hypothetical protein [Bacilli bacterium]
MKNIYIGELLNVKKEFLNKNFRGIKKCSVEDYELKNFKDSVFKELSKKGYSYEEIIKNNKILLDKLFFTKTIIPGVYKEIITGKKFSIPYLHENNYYFITNTYDIKPIILKSKSIKNITSTDNDLKTLSEYKVSLEAYINNKDIIMKVIDDITEYENNVHNIYNKKINDFLESVKIRINKNINLREVEYKRRKILSKSIKDMAKNK